MTSSRSEVKASSSWPLNRVPKAAVFSSINGSIVAVHTHTDAQAARLHRCFQRCLRPHRATARTLQRLHLRPGRFPAPLAILALTLLGVAAGKNKPKTKHPKEQSSQATFRKRDKKIRHQRAVGSRMSHDDMDTDFPRIPLLMRKRRQQSGPQYVEVACSPEEGFLPGFS